MNPLQFSAFPFSGFHSVAASARPSTSLGTLTHSTPLRVILSLSNGRVDLEFVAIGVHSWFERSDLVTTDYLARLCRRFDKLKAQSRVEGQPKRRERNFNHGFH